jgi:hypothetical protein
VAEFLIAVTVTKVAKSPHVVLDELSILQKETTDIFEDNAEAIMMVNAPRPTECSRHIGI